MTRRTRSPNLVTNESACCDVRNMRANLCRRLFFSFNEYYANSLSLQFPRRLRLASRLRARATYICCVARERERCAYGLIENDSSAKRMRVQQPGENASCASAGRNSESDQTDGFSNSLFFFFFTVTSAHLSPIQSMASGAKNNEAMRRDVNFPSLLPSGNRAPTRYPIVGNYFDCI